MRDRYALPASSSPRVEDMPVVTATQLKTATADVFDQLAKNQAVAIHRHDKPRGVLLSVEQYEALVGDDGDWLSDLVTECRTMLDEMQSPEQKAAALRLFCATPEELGQAALEAAQRKIAAVEIAP